MRLQEGHYIRSFEAESKPDESLEEFLTRVGNITMMLNTQLDDLKKKAGK